MNVLRILTISVASYNKIFNLGDFYKINFFFEKPIYFIYYCQFLNVLWGLTFSVAFYHKFATFSNFLKKINLFSKNPPFFPTKKPKLWTFWEFLPFQSLSAAIMLHLLFFFNKTFFFEEPFFCSKKPKVWTFKGNLLIRCFLQQNCWL